MRPKQYPGATEKHERHEDAEESEKQIPERGIVHELESRLAWLFGGRLLLRISMRLILGKRRKRHGEMRVMGVKLRGGSVRVNILVMFFFCEQRRMLHGWFRGIGSFCHKKMSERAPCRPSGSLLDFELCCIAEFTRCRHL